MMCFDVENFHPSISSNLSKKSIEFARQSIKISDDDLSINIQAKKMFLFEGTIPWIKITGDEDFDVPLVCFDGAEICVLLETYIHSKLINITNKEEVGLYHDDGLAIFKNISSPEIQRKKEAIVKMFKYANYQL